jgi:beta-galactosidase
MPCYRNWKFCLLRLSYLFGMVLLGALSQAAYASQPHPHTFGVEEDHFVLDGKPFEILSGEMHYARIPREYWRDRIRMAKAMGLNTIATYVFWNVHEPTPGVYNFSGNADLAAFLRVIQEEGMYVILRAGPYSCAEWEFGGYPAWLMADPKMTTALRSDDPAFMSPVERWMKRLGQEVANLRLSQGGPILAVQMENEYGNFGGDKVYLAHIKEIFLKAGFKDSLLFTTDPTRGLANGSLEGTFAAVNFGVGRSQAGLEALAAVRPGQPLFAAEYWPGWFDHWGQPHIIRPVEPQLKDLEYILQKKASVNLYMFHGGTSFGFMSGSSWTDNQFLPDVTSYDYDAPLDEAGHPTEKYYEYRKVFEKYAGKPLPAVPAIPATIEVPSFSLKESASLWENLPAAIDASELKPMEFYGQAYGFILYRIKLHDAVHCPMVVSGLNDYALVYINGRLEGVLDRRRKQEQMVLNAPADAQLDILVENSGRINSTKMMRHENKGLAGVNLNGVPLKNWQVFCLPMDNLDAIHYQTMPVTGPAFYHGSFQLKKVGDTFLDIRSLGKGVLWINGHAIGRYWNIGPQATLFVPAPWLKKGRNEVVLFDLQEKPGIGAPQLTGLKAPFLNAPVSGPGAKADE